MGCTHDQKPVRTEATECEFMPGRRQCGVPRLSKETTDASLSADVKSRASAVRAELRRPVEARLSGTEPHRRRLGEDIVTPTNKLLKNLDCDGRCDWRQGGKGLMRDA